MIGGAAARGDRPAIVDGATGRMTSYGELAARVDRVAAGLQAEGIGAGEVVALIGANSTEWAIAYHAILRAGAVVTPLNPLLTPEEVGKQLLDSGSVALIAMPQLIPSLTGTAIHDGIGRVWSLGPADDADDAIELGEPGATPEDVGVDPEDLAVLPYSSGTTGLMKGVMLTHRNLVANIEQAWTSMPIAEEDTLVGVLPFFHSYGQTVVLNLGLSKGATIVTMARFDLDGLLDILERHRVTWLHIAPPVVLAFATAPEVEGRDTSALKMVISGAAPLDEDLAKRAEERIGAPIRQGYGMTELSPVSHKSRLADAAETPPGSIGPLIPNTEARLVDPATLADVPEGRAGEIWVRGPQVMRGYLNNRRATEETLIGDGWLRTGDIGRVDERGYFYIVDRLKELIKYKGYQVAPAELEAVLVSHPKVRDAGVIGVPMEDGGEAPKACVVCDGGLDIEELIAYVAERVAPYKRIREVERVEEIPKSASGKILRRLLREEHGGARAPRGRTATGASSASRGARRSRGAPRGG
ncbi:MAG TPA: AMP-binding protein [Solirubrobacterales bacterium]|nr:AMP-binding protein [Solirubrobacterales bacterium]